MSRPRIHHEEERAPCGQFGALTSIYHGYGQPAPDLTECLATRLGDLRNSMAVWEPLHTKAPGPHLTQPWCCYMNTVIFYRRPHMVMPPKPWRDRAGTLHKGTTGNFFEWGRVETRLHWHSIVACEGVQWEVGGGRVGWFSRRWWMLHWLRRRQQQSQAA